jgi:hypothetical protein
MVIGHEHLPLPIDARHLNARSNAASSHINTITNTLDFDGSQRSDNERRVRPLNVKASLLPHHTLRRCVCWIFIPLPAPSGASPHSTILS